MFLKDYLERTIGDYEKLLSKNSFKSTVERQETQKVVDTLKEQLIKINIHSEGQNIEEEEEEIEEPGTPQIEEQKVVQKQPTIKK